ncbi:MAG TPA: hypothetical protein VNA16_09985, partial [Abditibacteriaceae bacterium]|nr:hypothetical protein [Abditibacteriaceae bacterium]
LDVGPNQARELAQVPQSSCPFLYAWNGERFAIVTDCNWRSPLGMLFARGAPIPHHLTRDFVRVPGAALKENEGILSLAVVEELRELNYLDQAALMVVDHPPGPEVYVDERMVLGTPTPLTVYPVRRKRLPVAARDGQGNDVLPVLQARDGVHTEPLPPARKGLHGLRPAHDMILDLGKVPDPKNIRLFLQGYVFPDGTSDNIAVSQDRGFAMQPSTLSVPDGRGGWKVAIPDAGMPAGRHKTIVLDLSGKFPARDYRVKFTTCFELRWDAAFYTSGEQPVPLRQRVLSPSRASLRYRGYSTRYRDGRNGPVLYDYQRLAADPGWPAIPGAYTRFGDVTPLLQRADDQYIISGPGEEIRIEFDARRIPPLAGWQRDYVFITDGWTKDTDPNTVTGQQVGPLPFHGMKKYPYGPEERFPSTPAHRRWQATYNTRRIHFAPRLLASQESR